MYILNKRENNVDEIRFVKDESEYLVFACNECHQYSYVKITQKTKKCLRCGRSYQVKTLLTSGSIVKGMSTAVRTVKELQNRLGTPSFHADQEFVITSKSPPTSTTRSQNPDLSSDETKFLSLLANLSCIYKQFPLYIIKLMAPDYDIPKERITTLIAQNIKSKILVKKEDYQYCIQLPSQ